MAQNILFNFIEHYLANSGITFPNCLRLQKDANKEGRQYYRFDLRNTDPISLPDEQHVYTLVNHHISIYEIERRSTAVLSQYHYTAYFIDEEEREYQLHVYFNDKNELTTPPVFSIRQEPENFVKVTKQFNDELINLAVTNSEPVIGTLKKRLAAKVQTLEKRYKRLEARASTLSTSIADNYPTYIQTLEQITATARLLVPLVNHNFYQSIEILINRMRDTLVHQHDNEQSLSSANTSMPSKQNEEEEENVPPLRSQKNTSRKETRHPSEFDQQVTKLARQIVKLDSDQEEIRVTRLADLVAKIHELSLVLEDKKINASLQSLETLRVTHYKLYEVGEKLFTRLLMNNKFELAAHLPAFHYLLNSYLDRALETRNERLLSFILEHNDVPINHQSVTVKGKSYPSAVQCCFSLDSKTTPMADCLAVLIQHGASVLLSNGNDLPIVHTILSANNHPLKKAFSVMREKTLGSIQFYKQLIASLNLYLEEHGPQLKTKQRQVIKDQLANYHVIVKELARKVTPVNDQEKTLQAQVDNFREEHSDEIDKRIRQDPEVIELIKRVQSIHKEYLKGLTRIQRLQFAKTNLKDLDEIDKFAKNSNKDQRGNFDTRKKRVLLCLRHSLKLEEKRLELLKVEKELKRYKQSRNKGIPLFTQRQVLRDEIAKLDTFDIEEEVEDEVKKQTLSDKNEKLRLQFLSNVVSAHLARSAQQKALSAEKLEKKGDIEEKSEEVQQHTIITSPSAFFSMPPAKEKEKPSSVSVVDHDSSARETTAKIG